MSEGVKPGLASSVAFEIETMRETRKNLAPERGNGGISRGFVQLVEANQAMSQRGMERGTIHRAFTNEGHEIARVLD